MLVKTINNQNLEDTHRLDAAFYQDVKFKAGIRTVALGDVAEVFSGNSSPIKSSYIDDGISYYRGQNTNVFFLEYSDPVKIAYSTFKRVNKCQLKKDDICLSIVGTVGNSSVLHVNKTAACSSKIAVLRNFNNFFCLFIAIYLKTKLSQEIISRHTRSTDQPCLAISDVRSLRIPLLPLNFQEKIASMVDEAHDLVEKANTEYRQAEELLLSEIGYDEGKLSKDNTAVKLLSETQGRFDANFYMRRYEELEEMVCSVNHTRLKDVVFIHISREPGSTAYKDYGVPFVRVSDISKYGISAPELFVDSKAADGYMRLTKNTIVFSKDGSVGTAYKVNENTDFITSNAVLQLQIKDRRKLLPDYLVLLLNSPVTSSQIKKSATGSNIPHVTTFNIKNLLIPLLPPETQQKITDLVQSSFTHRRQSEEMINKAVEMVEKEIE